VSGGAWSQRWYKVGQTREKNKEREREMECIREETTTKRETKQNWIKKISRMEGSGSKIGRAKSAVKKEMERNGYKINVP